MDTTSTFFFFFNDTSTTEIYTLSLHDALPIFQTTQLEEETGQANTARPDFDAHEVEGHHQPVHKSESGTTLKESGHIGTDIKGVMPCPPGLQSGAGHLKLLSSLTLGQALGSQLTIVLEELRTFESLP